MTPEPILLPDLSAYTDVFFPEQDDASAPLTYEWIEPNEIAVRMEDVMMPGPEGDADLYFHESGLWRTNQAQIDTLIAMGNDVSAWTLHPSDWNPIAWGII